MIVPVKFSLNRSDKLFITNDWYCNGHWCLKRCAANLHNPLFKRLDAKLSGLKSGTYHFGLSNLSDRIETCPDIEMAFSEVTRKVEGVDPELVTLRVTDRAIVNADTGDGHLAVTAIELLNGDQSVWLSPRYFPLLSLGTPKQISGKPLSIITMIQDDQIVAGVLPRRR